MPPEIALRRCASWGERSPSCAWIVSALRLASGPSVNSIDETAARIPVLRIRLPRVLPCRGRRVIGSDRLPV